MAKNAHLRISAVKTAISFSSHCILPTGKMILGVPKVILGVGKTTFPTPPAIFPVPKMTLGTPKTTLGTPEMTSGTGKTLGGTPPATFPAAPDMFCAAENPEVRQGALSPVRRGEAWASAETPLRFPARWGRPTANGLQQARAHCGNDAGWPEPELLAHALIFPCGVLAHPPLEQRRQAEVFQPLVHFAFPSCLF
jgi:hypothetical protein